jgi:hypothetical protein
METISLANPSDLMETFCLILFNSSPEIYDEGKIYNILEFFIDSIKSKQPGSTKIITFLLKLIEIKCDLLKYLVSSNAIALYQTILSYELELDDLNILTKFLESYLL